MFRIIYKYNDKNTSGVNLAQESYTFEEITQLLYWKDSYSEKYRNFTFSKSVYDPALPGEICLFPIDFQSTPFESILDTVIKICSSAQKHYPNNKKIILIYTTTEPFIFGKIKGAFKSVEKAVSGPINEIKNLGIKIGNVFNSIGAVYAAMIQLMIRLFKLKAKLDKFAKRFENCN